MRAVWAALIVFAATPSRAEGADSRRTPVVIAIDRVKGAVVNVSTEEYVRPRVPGPAGEVYNSFFRDMAEASAGGPDRRMAVNSLGSGVIIDTQGHVLTNFHVIARGARIKVGLMDGRELPASVVGTDTDSDLAVLQVNAPDLPAAPLGTSKDLMIGEPAIAIGNPFGLSHTVTTGVVSALHRSVRAEGKSFYDFIQTDAAINPGNSGGPLLNINGEVVGINTAIYAEGHGIGFAIPIDRARLLAQEIITHGEVREAWLGITVSNRPSDRGVVVSDVEPGSLAAQAHLAPGDVLTQFNGSALQDAEQFRYLLRGVPVGQAARLQVSHGGAALQLELTTTELPAAGVEELVARRLGLEIAEVPQPTPIGVARELVVHAVRSGSAAAHLGLRTGDVLRAVNALEVGTLEDFRRAFRRARHGGNAVLLIQRGAALEQYEFAL